MGVDRNKTLEDLDGEDWDEPTLNSYVVTNCHRLRRVPLKNFTAEDLRLMIGQEEGLVYLMPLAVERLEKNPFARGDFYPGDLLNNVLGVDPHFWELHPDLRDRMKPVAERALVRLRKKRLTDEMRNGLKERLKSFGREQPNIGMHQTAG